MDYRCPFCGGIFDFEEEFKHFSDEGDYITAWTFIECECGETLRVEANFVWDGKLEAR